MLTDVITVLKTTGLPVTYDHWAKGQVPKLPYLVVTDQGRDDVCADDQHYLRINLYNVEYYFEKKDSAIENRIESLFIVSDYQYDISEDIWIDTEQFFEKLYPIAVPNKGANTNGATSTE